MFAHLLTNPRHLQSFLNAIDHAVIFLSKDYCVMEMNDAAKHVLQFSAAVNQKKTFLEFCAAYGYSLQAWLQTDAQRPTTHEETYVIDNNSYSILWKIIPLAVITDNVEGYIIFGCDITPEKCITNQLRKTEFFYDNVLAKLPTNVYWKDINSTYLGCNDRLATLLGLVSRHAIVGMTDFDFGWDENTAKSFIDFDKEVMRTGEALTTEDVFEDASGKSVTVLTNKTPLKNERGESIGVLAISVDITDKKEAELELIKAKTEAEAANKAKSVFLANISHDIRTPLTGMLGLTESLKQNAENKKNQEDAQLLMGVTQEILHLLNEIIEVVRLDHDQFVPKNEIFSMESIVLHNITLMAAAAKNKNIDLRYSIDKNVPQYLIGNATYLNRVFINLLSNAIKFTPKGYISLSVSVAKILDNTVYLQCSIEDTGIGIPTDQFDKIFENFHRLNPSHEGLYAGNGMGLYMVKKYIEIMNGAIYINSQLGQGSIFTIEIPFKVSELPPSNQTKTVLTESMTAIHKSEPFIKKTAADDYSVRNPLATVLVVEDNPLAARSAQQILQQADCASDHALTGEEALKKMKNNHYDLVLMDIGLPDFDGCEVTRRIRQCIPAEQLPIVALTGHMLPEQKQACLAVGMQDMLIKPLNDVLLRNVLGTYVFPSDETAGEGEAVHSPHTPNAEQSLDHLKTVDLEEGARLLRSNLESAKEMIVLFLQSLPADLEEIQQCYASGDMDKLYKIIHKFYGGLCYCGIPRLRAITLGLKTALLAKDPKERGCD